MSDAAKTLAAVLETLRERGFAPTRIDIPGVIVVEMREAAAEPEERDEKPEPDRRARALGLTRYGDAG